MTRLTGIIVTATTVTTLTCNMVDERQREARSDVVIGSEVSCPTCSIVVDSVVTLEGAYFGGPAATIAHGPPDLFYLVDRGEAVLKAYGIDGRFVRQIGRRGAGPGEYERIRNVLVAPDGSIHVLDGMLGRVSAFTRNGDFLGSTQVPVVGGVGWPAVLLPGNQLVVNTRPVGAVAGPEAGYALTSIDREGNVLRLFDQTSSSDPRNWWLYERLLWNQPSAELAELFVARPYTFTIDVYSSDVTRQFSVRRVGESIPSQPPESEPSDGLFDKPATPQLRMMWEDTQGLLWLGIVVPSPSWRPGPPQARVTPLNETTASTLVDRPRFDTIIEVVDVGAQRVLARSRFNGSVGTPFGGGYLAQSVQDSAGEPSIRISRVQLKQ